MILEVFAVFDSAANCFGRPVFTASVGIMMRSFSQEVNRIDPENMMNLHPEDFTLFHLASFDDATGRFQSFTDPVRSARAVDVIVRPVS